MHLNLSKCPTAHTQAPKVLVWGGGAKASMMGTGGQKSEQHMLTWKSNFFPLRSPNRFWSWRATLFWIGMFYHVLPCDTMWNYVLWNVKCHELCKFFYENEWIQIVLKLFVALKAWLPGALHFIKVPTTHAQAPLVLVCGWWCTLINSSAPPQATKLFKCRKQL